MIYDYLIVGSGLFGCTFANLAKKDNKKCLIIDKRDHPFGNCYTEYESGIHIHRYGPHIFHTSCDAIWQYVNQFAKFNNYINRPKVNFEEKIYSFPINLLTLYQLWGVNNPIEAEKKLSSVRLNIENPQNLEEWILSKVGHEIYEKFIYGYTKKQWNTEPKNLPSSIIKRLPIRLTFDDNYFNDIYQGIPVDGYSNMMQNMVDGVDVLLCEDYLLRRDYWNSQAKTIIYTGAIDAFFDFEYNELDYRSLRFEHIKLDIPDYQGNAIINYTSDRVPYTRIVEHKHFDNHQSDVTIISKEYPANFQDTLERFYPINNEINNNKYIKYTNLAKKQNKIFFGGRLAQYRYYDMHQVIGAAISKYKELNHDN